MLFKIAVYRQAIVEDDFFLGLGKPDFTFITELL